LREKSLEQWALEYAESHQNPLNQKIHKLCVPLVILGGLGLASSVYFPLIPFVPVTFAWILLFFSLRFYLRLNGQVFLVMLGVAVLYLLLIYVMQRLLGPTPWLYGALFIVGWTGQFIGHRYERKKPSFFSDLQFLLIGPLWAFGALPKNKSPGISPEA
jgi:uncharacterized membrane protein YGL010W